MSGNWPQLNTETEAEMQLADALLGKADALLRRHRSSGAAAARQSEKDDLPLLTDVVSEQELAAEKLKPPPGSDAPTPQPTPPPGPEPALLAETLIQLDTDIAREVEVWLATELPQILTRELGGLAERIRVETLAQLRATLLPALSERIASELDKAHTR